MWLTVEPVEHDSPLIIDPDGVEILEITLQFFERLLNSPMMCQRKVPIQFRPTQQFP